ncbi:MAG: NAD(P)/FAD-dependent oxidoreductase [Chloroflexi bacterium]|nr:NAD(P)/FAD-dependent oxidoreductase [Chloroflexota bacterium]
MSRLNHVIVIGGGPAGLMAAGQASLHGARTLLLEKMDTPGRKLRITGMGRCNLTNIIKTEEFIAHFGPNGRFLRQAFSRFFNQDLIEFLEGIGIETVTERGGRVFPRDMDAKALTEKLIDWAKTCGVEIITKSPVERITYTDGKVNGILLRDGRSITCSQVILATGGASYIGTGSTGDGFRMAEALGHTIVTTRPALVPLKTMGTTAQQLQGLPLRNVKISLFIDGKKSNEMFGEMLFTHFGVSGPLMLTLSGEIVDALNVGKSVEISIDLKPALNEDQLDARLRRELDAHGKQKTATMLKRLVPIKMVPVCAELARLTADKPCHQITAGERSRLLHWLKDFRLTIHGHLPLEAAMITAGGISLKEVDPRTMASRIVEGLYFAGEVLDLAADTGGYNLQEAFSTGCLAGRSAAGILS